MLERALEKLSDLLAAESMPFNLADKLVVDCTGQTFF